MRHRKFGYKLNRTSSHRKAMRRNLVLSLFRHGRIVTTMPKAKAARRDAERLITMGKVETVHNYRKAFAYLQDKQIVSKLFKEISLRYRDTQGGYTAIHRLSENRLGDNASQVVWQLVTWEPGSKPKPRRKKKAKKDPSRKKEAQEKAVSAEETQAEEAPAEEAGAGTAEESKPAETGQETPAAESDG